MPLISILLVDDNAIVRKTLRRLLLSYGFEICGEAENGQEGIEKAKALNPDVVILDLSMPLMNGLQAARILQDVLPQVRMVMYTSHTSTDLSKLALAAGIDTVIDKSGPIEALLSQLRGLDSKAS